MAEGDEKLELELESFRRRWHNEIQAGQDSTVTNSNVDANVTARCNEAEQKEIFNLATAEKDKQVSSNDKELPSEVDQGTENEEKAAKLFLRGVQLEKKKSMYDAIQFYKQAIRLVPDIESKISDFSSPSGFESDESGDSEDNLTENEQSQERSANLEWVTRKFKVLGVKGLCMPAFFTRKTHISEMPTELLINIFRWVVSSELDLRSLEQLSQVCKWFYACARDESVWRSACLRLFGVNCCAPNNYDGCWRQMLIERPHLNFQGVYINRTSYVRCGEQGLDAFYRPYHLVEYFRYLRFYADGTVLMCTTSDDPMTAIPMLTRQQHSAIVVKGQYCMTGDTVSIVTKKVQKNQSESRNRRARAAALNQEQIFHLELKLHNSGRKRGSQLTWTSYSYKMCLRSSAQVYSNEIDVGSYKPFYFSRVKRFHCISKTPL